MAGRRRDHDAGYVLDRIDTILGQASLREHRFDRLRGDPGGTGRSAHLPVDAYWPGLALVVEVYERQHDHPPVAHFDKLERLTVSGVHRGEQRRLYDQRRRSAIPPANGLTLLVVRTSQLAVDRRGRLLRDAEADSVPLSTLVGDALTDPGRVHESPPV